MKWAKMRKGNLLLFAIAFLLLLCLTGCKSHEKEPDMENSNPSTLLTEIPSKKTESTNTVQMIVGGKTFSLKLNDNRTATEFKEMLPLELNMEELNGNEKFAYLQNAMPSNPAKLSAISTGDVMLFGTDCLVLFYKDFSTTFSYTSIGLIENPTDLAEALGQGTAKVIFQ